MNKKRSEWANEEGSALVLTLMIFLVLTVLATSISFLTVGSFRLSDINRDGTSAFYIAEAGAKKAYEEASQEVMKTYEAATTTTSSNFYAALDALFLNKELSFDKQFGDDAKANVTFTATGSNPRKYTLTSTGSVGGKTRTVQKQFDVSWVEKGGSGGFPALPKNAALMTKGKTTFSGGAKIIGDIHTSSVGDKSIKFSGGAAFENTTLFYPNTANKDGLFVYENNITGPKVEPTTNTINFDGYKKLIDDYVVPTKKTDIFTLPDNKYFSAYGGQKHYLVENGSINFHSGFPQNDDYGRNLSSYTLDVNKNLEFKDIKINSRTLVINPNGGNRVILLENLEVMSGTIEILGKGRVTLVITNTIKFNENSYINNQTNSDSNQLTIIYTGSTPKFSGLNRIKANIIVKNKNSTIELGNSNVNGVFLTDSKKVIFNASHYGPPAHKLLLIAPYALVDLSSSIAIEGSIIANTFEMSGGAQLKSATIDTSGFPVGSDGATSTPTLEDLLKSGPILEQ